MNVCGIVAEYNPFHKGHMYHIEQTRAAGADAIIAVMGSHVTQRGELAVFSKWARTKAAIMHGVDLVLELPAVYTASSAERFAAAATYILAGTGVADSISFGSECGDIDLLRKTAEVCAGIDQSPELAEMLKQGYSYPAARQRAAAGKLGGAVILSNPNDTLGVEYIKAIIQQRLPLTPLAVKREGSGHNGGCSGEYASASYIRENLPDSLNFIPGGACGIFLNEIGRGFRGYNLQSLETAILYCLKTADKSQFQNIPDISEGLHNRMYAAAVSAVSLDGYIDAVKTKRYTRTRICRHILQLALKADCDLSMHPPYIRVLGFNDTGRGLLALMRKKSGLPVYSSFARLERDFPDIAAAEKNATNLFSLSLAQPSDAFNEYKQQVVFLSSDKC